MPQDAGFRDAEDLPRQGDVLEGKYQIGFTIGRGGMGTVFSAIEIGTNRAVAIKTLNPLTSELGEASGGANNREELERRLLREARAAGEVASERVARVYHVGRLLSGTPFIVLELLKGKTLDSLVRPNAKVPIDRAADLMIEICEGLAAAHAAGIIHRDLKPSNLFLAEQPDGRIILKILDFGISKAPGLESPDLELPTLTSTGVMLGSPQYMSPEQLRNARSVDVRSDIFSLGVVLHRLLTAKLPFDAETLPAYAAAVAADQPTPLRRHRPDAPAGIERVILRCLEKPPGYRFASAAALADALAPFASMTGKALAERIALDYGEAPTVQGGPPRILDEPTTVADDELPTVREDSPFEDPSHPQPGAQESVPTSREAEPHSISLFSEAPAFRRPRWKTWGAIVLAMALGAGVAIFFLSREDASSASASASASASETATASVTAPTAATATASPSASATATVAAMETAAETPPHAPKPGRRSSIAPPSAAASTASSAGPKRLKPLMEDKL